MKSLLLAIGATILMAGCGSAVKLDDVPVEDKAGTVVSQPGAEGIGGAGTGVGKGGATGEGREADSERVMALNVAVNPVSLSPRSNRKN